MKTEKLVHMANEIAAFFRPYPEEEARAGLRDHVRKFWTPGMRSALLAHAAAGGAGLDPVAVSALRREPHAESPIIRETGGPGVVGQMASDAG